MRGASGCLLHNYHSTSLLSLLVQLACLLLSCCVRIAKRRQQMSLPARRQLGYSTGSKKDDKKTTLLAEDVADALKEVSSNTLGVLALVTCCV